MIKNQNSFMDANLVARQLLSQQGIKCQWKFWQNSSCCSAISKSIMTLLLSFLCIQSHCCHFMLSWLRPCRLIVGSHFLVRFCTWINLIYFISFFPVMYGLMKMLTSSKCLNLQFPPPPVLLNIIILFRNRECYSQGTLLYVTNGGCGPSLSKWIEHNYGLWWF